MSAAASAYIIEDQRRMQRARNYFAWQARLVRPELGRRVVEIGCGVGNFTSGLLDRECVVAIDADPACVDLLKSRHPSVECLTRDAGREDLSDLARFRPDSCLFINVLEHIENDLKALRDAASILPAGGVVIILAPAFPRLYGPIDEKLGHYRRYTRAGICRLAAAAKLRIDKLHYLNAAGFFGWWMNSHVLRLQAQSEAQIGFFDRWVVPVMARLEGIVKPPFGQSLFAVLRKV